jgi:hypothetical protein
VQEHQGAQSQQPFQEVRQTANALIAAAQIMGKMAEVFLRVPGTFGDRFLGLQAVFSWIILLIWGPLIFPTEDPRPMLWLWIAATVMLIIHRITGAFRKNEEHSLYSGRPILSWFFADEIRLKGTWEPMVVVVAGIGALSFSIALGSYLVAAGIAIGIGAEWQRAADRAKVRAMRDARIEQEWLMQQNWEH